MTPAPNAASWWSPSRRVLSAPLQPRAILFACWITAQMLVLPMPGPLRFIAAAFLFGAAPGLAWVPLLGLDRGVLMTATSVLLISVAADVVVAQICMALVGLAWGPCATALIALTVLGAGARIMADRLAHPGTGWSRPSTAS